MPGLNVVALTSGGKDSIFTILHCLANNHEVIALANLHPPENEAHERVDDMGSYMYQTIGHAIIPLYQQALGLPLFRQEIVGSALNRNKSYGPGAGVSAMTLDETECLVPLLRRVMFAHPEVNAISTGAILSDYQRTRVESVALRLGLIPLSYLWQWPSLPPHTPTSLLEDMAAVGQDSRIVQVASGGLDDNFLWQNVSEHTSITRLSKAAERFGTSGDGAVLGEGGEFETLTINGPPPLWKGHIVIDPVDTEIIPGEAGSSSLRLKKASVEMKLQENAGPVNLRIPALLDSRFTDLLTELMSKLVKLRDELVSSPIESAQSGAMHEPETENTSSESTASLSNIPKLFGRGTTAAEQTRSIMDVLLQKLAERNQGPTNIVYTVIVLRDMGDFASVNGVYGSYFTEPNPPARLTIACADVLPVDAHLMMGFTTADMTIEGLHVQSRSYWAPANIGPYSQAIKVPFNNQQPTDGAVVLVAGQIPLVPASMELVMSPDGDALADFVYEVVLSLQHLIRIGRVMKAEATIIKEAWSSLKVSNPSATLESDEEENFDVWHVHNRQRQAHWRTNHITEPESVTEDVNVVPKSKLYIIRVDSLPRGSNIEWVSYGQTDDTPVTLAPDHLRSLLSLFQARTVAVSV